MELDPYLDPATGILRNRLGANTQQELSAREADFTFVRQMQLASRDPDWDFDLEHLKSIHRALFQDVYDWAGELRTVRISKGGTLRGQQLVTTFAMPGLIEGAFAQSVTKRVTTANLASLCDPTAFSAFAAGLLGDLNHLHPFREGNGRAQREFLRQLGLVCSLRLDWSRVSPIAMIEASIQSSHVDNAALADVIQSAIDLEPILRRPLRRIR